MPKRTVAEIGCGFFLLTWTAIAKQLQIFLFHFATGILKNHIFKTLFNSTLHAPKFLKIQSLNQKNKQIYSHLATTNQASQKNHNWFWL